MGARADLAAAITAAIATAGIDADVTVYSAPVDLTKLPAVVIDADNDYIQPATYGPGGPGALLWSFVVHLTVPRATPEHGFDLIESLRAAIVLACNDLGATMGILSGPETVPVNDVPTLQSHLEIQWLTERTT